MIVTKSGPCRRLVPAAVAWEGGVTMVRLRDQASGPGVGG